MSDDENRDHEDEMEKMKKALADLRKENERLNNKKEKEENTISTNTIASTGGRVVLYRLSPEVCQTTLQQMKLVFKDVVFRRQKFVTDEELTDLSSAMSLPNIIMTKMMVPKDKRFSMWSEYGIAIKRMMERERSARTTALRNEFYKTGE